MSTPGDPSRPAAPARMGDPTAPMPASAPIPEGGRFLAVGVGPGAPDLLTLRAVRAIESAAVVIIPRSERSETSLARSCIAPWIQGQEVWEHVYPMTRDEESTRASWRGVAERAAAAVHAGRRVAQVTLGDPLIYATSAYLLAELAALLPPERIEIVPGISAFQAAGARVGDVLLTQEDRLTLMPGTDLKAVAEALDHCETLVLYKAGRSLPALRDLLAERGLAEHARALFYVEQGDRETVVRSLAGVEDEALRAAGYMATVLIRVGRRGWNATKPDSTAS